MITEKLIQDCIAYDKAEYNEVKTPDQIQAELEKLEARGCLVEHCLHCPGCPKFGINCPI